MLKTLKSQLFLVFGFLIIGFGLALCQITILRNIGITLFYLSIAGFVVSPIVYHIRLKRSLKVMGIYLVIFSAVNYLRHYLDFYSLYHIKDLIENDYYFASTRFLVYIPIWLIMTLVISVYTLKCLKTTMLFEHFLRTRLTTIVIVLIAILILLEMPIFNWHGDFGGGLHGHPFWDFWHIH